MSTTEIILAGEVVSLCLFLSFFLSLSRSLSLSLCDGHIYSSEFSLVFAKEALIAECIKTKTKLSGARDAKLKP